MPLPRGAAVALAGVTPPRLVRPALRAVGRAAAVAGDGPQHVHGHRRRHVGRDAPRGRVEVVRRVDDDDGLEGRAEGLERGDARLAARAAVVGGDGGRSSAPAAGGAAAPGAGRGLTAAAGAGTAPVLRLCDRRRAALAPDPRCAAVESLRSARPAGDAETRHSAGRCPTQLRRTEPRLPACRSGDRGR